MLSVLLFNRAEWTITFPASQRRIITAAIEYVWPYIVDDFLSSPVHTANDELVADMNTVRDDDPV